MKLTAVKLYQYAVLLFAAFLVLTAAFSHYESFLQPQLIFLLLLYLLVESIQIPLWRGYGSLTYGVTLGTMVLYGPHVAAPLVAIAVTAAPLIKRNNRGTLLHFFNGAQHAVSVFAAYGIFQGFGGGTAHLTGSVVTLDFLILIPVTLMYMVMNHFFVQTLFILRRDKLTPQDFLHLFISDAMNYLISTPFAVFMLAFDGYAPILFLVFIPLVLFGQVLKLYRKITMTNKAHEVVYRLQSEFDVQTISCTITESVRELTSSVTAALWVLEKDRLMPIHIDGQYHPELMPKDGYSLSEGSITSLAVQSKQVESVPDTMKDKRIMPKVEGFKSFLVVPLKARDKVVGVLTCFGSRTHAYTEEQIELITVLAAQVGVLIENASLYRELQEATLRDPGTGLYNYRYFYQELSRRFELAKAESRPMSIVILDIDHFKKYNDTYGHVVGDEVLRQTAQVIQHAVGNTGVVARYGGEEFALLLNASLEEAQQIVEGIRRALHFHKFEYQGYVVQGVTVSVGVASYPDHDQNEKELLEKADQAMYWGAKQRGRDKVAVYTPDFDTHLFVDKLTGLYTYHYLRIKLMEEFMVQSQENGQSFALIFLNIAEFNTINRTFGFEVGNMVLREIALLIKENVRNGEIAARYGGDEYLLLVPLVNREDAERIMERLQKAVASHKFKVGDNVLVRVRSRADIVVFPDEVSEGPQLVSQIAKMFLHLSSDWLEQKQKHAEA
ncbi:sensor domain-containing diguanylate cyclase [Tumebacillus algifaecis]|uniref:sensor domain-containing diguanylate cyclase n=1 Tax=Tumebacillus algifaecis TaxID=1214604 RepID=UPI001560E677|nr:sensor domain-containing diguanylate cyclase [Tumebacillus algifaecis]